MKGKPVPVFDIAFDISKVPAREVFDVSFEFMGHELPPDLLQSGTVYVDAKTTLLTCWLLLPEGKHHQSMELLRHPIGKASNPERVTSANELVSPDGAMVAFTLLNLEPGFNYERRWTHRD